MLPLMRSKNQSNIYSITSFGGYNPGYSRKLNELKDSCNMSSASYPALAAAKMPALERSLQGTAISAGFFDKLYTLEYTGEESGKIFLCTENSQTEISSFNSKEELEAKRKLAFMKDEILIIPDNMIYYTNTATVKAGCASEGTTRQKSQEKFEKESLTDDTLPMKYNTWYSAELTGSSIVSMSATYKVSSKSYTFYDLGLSDAFEIGDVVTLKMNVKPIDATQDSVYRAYVKKMAEGITVQIKDLVKTSHSTPSGTVTEYTELHFDDNAIDMGGYNDVCVLSITVEKGIPNFVDVCALENRMWGVSKDKIYASKLGDSSEWNDFTVDNYGTLPSSSFATEVESDGAFTGITTYNGSILAFKEDCIHKIYGNEPAEYTVSRIDCPGVSENCKETTAVINGVLYYMGREGAYAFSGSLPRLISTDIITPGFDSARASGDNRYYYIECEYSDGKKTYVYDTEYKLWHKTEGISDLVSFVKAPEGMYLVSQNKIFKAQSLAPDTWSFAFSFGTKEFSSKHICAFGIRYYLGEGGEFTVKLINRVSTYTIAASDTPADNGIITMNIPVSCAKDASLIFEGKGDFALTSLDVRYKETGIND